MKIKLIFTSCLRVFKTGELLGIPESKFYLKAGMINIDHIDGDLRSIV